MKKIPDAKTLKFLRDKYEKLCNEFEAKVRKINDDHAWNSTNIVWHQRTKIELEGIAKFLEEEK